MAEEQGRLVSSKDIIAELSEETGQSKYTLEKVFDALNGILESHLKEGDKVRVRGIGQFDVVDKPAREVWVPSKGGKTEVPASRKTKVRPAPNLRSF